MLRAFLVARGAAVALAICSTPLSPLSAAAPSAPIEQRIARLKPGHSIWTPAASPDGAVQIVVSIPLQMAYVYRGGTLIGASTVSTGQPGFDTPTGRFEILQKRKDHYSNLYDNAPMPHMQRLTWDGIALHGGAVPGHPASHGCVRLPKSFAAKLFGITDLGAEVLIVDEAPSPEAAYAMLQGRTFETAMGGPEEPIEPAAPQPSPAIAELGRTLEGLAGQPD